MATSQKPTAMIASLKTEGSSFSPRAQAKSDQAMEMRRLRFSNPPKGYGRVRFKGKWCLARVDDSICKKPLDRGSMAREAEPFAACEVIQARHRADAARFEALVFVQPQACFTLEPFLQAGGQDPANASSMD